MGDPLLAIEGELRAEKASALAIAAEKLEKALAELAELERDFAAAPEPARRPLRERHRALRSYAAERLWFLLVQREAMGLTQHDNVLAFYRVPPELRKEMGRVTARAAGPNVAGSVGR